MIKNQLSMDLKRLLRDEFLLGAVGFILAMVLCMRFFLPAIQAELLSRSQWDLTPYYPLIASYLAASLGGVMVGMMSGMLLLETREQDALSAVMVSPLSASRLIVIESLAAYVLAFILILAQAWIVGVGLPSVGALVGIAAGCAAFAPLFMIALATFATNKLEAFALMKILGLFALAPVVAYFIPEPWQWGAAILPPYGAMKAWWNAASGHGPIGIWLASGLIVSALTYVGLLRRFTRVTQVR